MFVINHGPSSQEIYKSNYRKKITLTNNIDMFPDLKTNDKKLKSSLSRAGISIVENEREMPIENLVNRSPRIMSAINQTSVINNLAIRKNYPASAK